MPEGPATGDSGGMNGADNRSQPGTMQDFWANRPIRPRQGGKIGGVAAALGARYGIDPVLIRIVFVVAAFYGGSGITLYLLGWLVLPKEGKPVPGPYGPRPTVRSTSVLAIVLILLLLLPVLAWATDFAGLVGFALGLGALYLVHRNYNDRGGPPPGRTQPLTSPADPDDGAASRTNATQDHQHSTVDNGAWQEAPEWNTADSGWEYEADPEWFRRRWITLSTLAVAVILGVLTELLGLPLHIGFAVALGVLGAGMVLASFLRGGRTLIAIAIPVGAVAMLLSVGPSGDSGIPAHLGEVAKRISANPRTVDQVRPTYQTSTGNIDLDLRDLSDGSTNPVRTTARTRAGDVRMFVPPNADVDARCSSDTGRLNCLGSEQEGRNLTERVNDAGPDGPGGGSIKLDLRSSTGNVEVTRG